MHNTSDANLTITRIIGQVAKWHHERNLVEGATDWSQSKKLLEEFIEIVSAQMPGHTPDDIAQQVNDWVKDLLDAGRIKTVNPGDSKEALKDSIGDMIVVQINLAERNEWSLAECCEAAYDDIKDRKGKMINGTFVKESDL